MVQQGGSSNGVTSSTLKEGWGTQRGTIRCRGSSGGGSNDMVQRGVSSSGVTFSTLKEGWGTRRGTIRCRGSSEGGSRGMGGSSNGSTWLERRPGYQ